MTMGLTSISTRSTEKIAEFVRILAANLDADGWDDEPITLDMIRRIGRGRPCELTEDEYALSEAIRSSLRTWLEERP